MGAENNVKNEIPKIDVEKIITDSYNPLKPNISTETPLPTGTVETTKNNNPNNMSNY